MRRGPFLVLALAGLATLAWWWLWREPGLPAAGEALAPAAATPARPAGADAPIAPPAPLAGRDGRVAANDVAELLGRVVDASGRGVADIPVHLLPDPPLTPQAMLLRQQRGLCFEPVASATTDREGAFRLGVPPVLVGEPLRVLALGLDHGDATHRRVRAVGAATRVPDLVLPTARPVGGAVVDEATEAPIAGAVVSALPSGAQEVKVPGREGGRTAVSDATGQFVFAGLSAGSYTFRATAAGYAAEEHVQQAVFADQPTEQSFALRPGHRVAGQVVDREGRAVAGAWLTAVPLGPLPFARASAATDAAGAFALEGLGTGRWRLTVGKAGLCTLVHDVEAGTERLVLTMRPRGAIRLEVVDPDGQPAEEFTVSARPAAPAGGLSALPPQRVGKSLLHDGAFVLEDLEPGRWLVHVVAAGAAPATSEGVEVHEAETAAATVRLQRGATVRLQVLAADGKPLAAARVRVQADGFADGPVAEVMAPLRGEVLAGAETRTAADGRAALVHVASGSYQLRIDAEGHVPWYHRGVVVAQDLVELGTVVVPRGVHLHGVARVGDTVDPSVVVEVLALPGGNLPAGFRCEAAVDATGQWTCASALPPGRYAVLAGRRRADDPFLENQDHGLSRIEIELPPGEIERRVELSLPRRPQ